MPDQIQRPILHLPHRLSTLQPRVRALSNSPVNPVSNKRDAEAQERKRFYDSALWLKTREAKLRRDPLCQVCAADDLVTQASHVDHWIPLALGGHATADDNLVSCCVPCHSRKTMCERNGTAFPKFKPSARRTLALA